MKFIDLFAGIGGIRLAFERAGATCVWSCENNKDAIKTYEANFGHVEFPYDIQRCHISNIPEHDILTAGFPCQPFSQAGLKKGFEDIRGTLFFDIVRIINYHHPKVVFLENVKNLAGHDKGKTLKIIIKTLEDMKYKVYYKILNAKEFGLPQNRARIYIIAFRDNINFEFPKPPMTNTKVGDILEKKVDPKYTISDKLWSGHQRRKRENVLKGYGFGYSLFNENSPYTSTISARYYKDGSEILIEQKDKNPRKITPREASKLQGFPDDFIIPVSDTQAYKQFGNSVAVDTVYYIALEIIKSLRGRR